MLNITAKSGSHIHPWHVGEPWPELHGAVVTFQADGHELIYLLEVMRYYAGWKSYAIGVLGYTPDEV